MILYAEIISSRSSQTQKFFRILYLKFICFVLASSRLSLYWLQTALFDCFRLNISSCNSNFDIMCLQFQCISFFSILISFTEKVYVEGICKEISNRYRGSEEIFFAVIQLYLRIQLLWSSNIQTIRQLLKFE